MTSICNILSAVTDFLKEAQSLGLIKEFTLIQHEQMNEEEIPKADELLANFLDKIGCASVPTKHKNCSITEYVKVTEDEKECEDNIIVDPVEKDLGQMEVEGNDVASKKEELSHLVQIQVNSDEMKRRISAFITRKRKEVDEWNVQEFCGRSYVDEQDPAWDKLDSCARVDAVFVPRRGCKSHIKVSKVRNVCGPQTQSQPGAKKIKQEPCETENQASDASLPTIEERLFNMETHLKLKSDSSFRSDIFKRLKELENRILLLESTSPEYIHHLPTSDYSAPKKSNCREKIYTNFSTDEIERKIQNLKSSLKLKSIKREPIL